jgi:hypothetical protein
MVPPPMSTCNLLVVCPPPSLITPPHTPPPTPTHDHACRPVVHSSVISPHPSFAGGVQGHLENTGRCNFFMFLFLQIFFLLTSVLTKMVCTHTHTPGHSISSKRVNLQDCTRPFVRFCLNALGVQVGLLESICLQRSFQFV